MPELLDHLPVTNPKAAHSRRDLVRLNALMGNAGIIAHVLETASDPPPERLLEFGTGDGKLLLRIARRLASRWRTVEAHLLDRQPLVQRETQQAFGQLGWKTRVLRQDVFEWAQTEPVAGYQAIIANLFLHHFPNASLARLLAEAARRTHLFVAVEPKRSGLALTFSRLVWMIGCNEVTRHDAQVSVRAGFRGNELSRLWPESDSWSMQEGPAGWFGHLFVARRIEGGRGT